MADWNPRTFSFQQVLAAAHLNEFRDFFNRTAPAKVSAKGDLVAGTEAHEVGRIAVPGDGLGLIAASGEAAGWKGGLPGGVCKITGTSSVSASNITDKIYNAFNTEVIDSHGFADLTAHADRITIPDGMDGVYLVSGAVHWNDSATTTGARGVFIGLKDSSDVYKDGAWGTYLEAAYNDAAFTRSVVNVFTLLNCSVGDYIYISGRQSSGGNLSMIAAELTAAMLYKA